MDILCFSHLRWDFVYQRPQHLMVRFASTGRVFFIEEPHRQGDDARIEIKESSDNVFVITPYLSANASEENAQQTISDFLNGLIAKFNVTNYVAWFYSPMFVHFLTRLPSPGGIVYDCMDELSAFKNAPAGLQEQELRLFKLADLVFTGGNLLYETKKAYHANIHSFPSSIDKEHFEKARSGGIEADDQAEIQGVKIGFFGVIDERMDLALIDALAERSPHWNIILVGPVVKIDPATLPQRSNIFYMGSKKYEDLPAYLSGWDVALIPFAQNESTKFISPTKTPEYLAGGKPVVSTPIHDVVHPYGDEKLVYIASTPDEFIAGIEWSLERWRNPRWLQQVDVFLSTLSWDDTWNRMSDEIELVASQKVKTGTRDEIRTTGPRQLS
ncbi:MAG: glycosyltransferase family 1 protein [Chitinophagaceae bacterium]|nr:glycosyltransferase family 1 protein [Chitinophagaceae bacterium]